MRFPKFFFKLILFSLFLSIFPVITLGLYSYIKLTSSVEDKIYKANEQILLQNQMRVEQTLKTIEHSVVQFSNSQLLNDSLEQNVTFRQFDVFFQFYKELKKLQTIDLPIQDIYLVNFEKGWLINNNGLQSLDADEKRKYEQIMINTSWTLDTDDLSDRYTGGIKYLKKLPTDFAAHYSFLIVKIPYANLNKLIKSNNELGDIMILDKSYRVLSDKRNTPEGSDLSDTLLAKELTAFAGDSGYLSIKSESSEEAVHFRKSDYNGWIYITRTPVQTILSDSRAIGWITLWTCVGIFLLNLFISLFISRRMYTPILKLYQSAIRSARGPEPENLKDEFQIITNRFSSLLHGQSEWMLRNERQLPQLKDFFVLHLLDGKIKHEEIQHKIALYGFSGPWKHMSVIATEIDDLHQTRYTEKDLDLLLFAIHNMVGEIIPESKLFHSMVTRKTVVVLLGGDHLTADHFRQEPYVFSELLQSQVAQFLDLKISVGMSRIFASLMDAPTALEEALEALKYKFRVGAGSILFIGDVQPEDESRFSFPEKWVKELIDAVKLADEAMARRLLTSCIQTMAEKNITYKQYQILLAGLLTELIKEILKTGEYFPALHDGKKSMFDQLFALKTVPDTEQWFLHSIILPIVRIMARRKYILNKKISDLIIEIIHEDYDKDLTLESCAVRLNYHPNYIKRVFRQDTGSNFSEYLSQYRLKKAKEWLLETDMTISEIAEKLRFSNLQNFSRSFRRMVGVSPSEFKEQNERNYGTQVP
ncbi:helix-turn-helix domain-containing protein [Paenibacillus radicis (ex Xue et al. 2023)]|uniref:Helix-turn-helix domain-containing protein n=1 Tax=Paenibacillus radicis (ex Xue et al. 2023) TaxID=2972489 RepID=A0ABT1YRL5_9BACL|nr:helix-turn-helix domain-containing protein [Paenibacillus radicis (ex Xue et al. 2023)]MCR8635822.1 helix-turn-helix domain-containing protein [Paenibacillus radicis (ex Xue et al. 2023)]